MNKTGAGYLVLSGSNTYTGLTHVSGGTLQLSGVQSLLGTSLVNLDASNSANLVTTSGSVTTWKDSERERLQRYQCQQHRDHLYR